MLMQEGYPPALVLREWRPRYIQALQQAYTGEYAQLVDLVGLAVEQSLDLYLEACVESTAHLLSLSELAPLFNTTVDYLGQLAHQGKFEAKKRKQHWYASKEAVGQYFQEAGEQPRGRPQYGSNKSKESSHRTGDHKGSHPTIRDRSSEYVVYSRVRPFVVARQSLLN